MGNRHKAGSIVMVVLLLCGLLIYQNFEITLTSKITEKFLSGTLTGINAIRRSEVTAEDEVNAADTVSAETRRAQQDEEARMKQMNATADILEDRTQHLLQQCKVLHLNTTQSTDQTIPKKFLQKGHYFFNACVPPGSDPNAWKDYGGRLRTAAFIKTKAFPKNWTPPKLLVARHPLCRLDSYYRDVFLDGAPLFHYNDTFREKHKKRESWQSRWRDAWLPALMALGRQPLSAHTSDGIKKSLKKEVNNRKTMDKYKGESFTFEEFLIYLEWGSRYGLLPESVRPATDLCQPCNITYQFVLRYDSLPRELDYLMHVAQYRGDVRFSPFAAPADDARRYDSVPRDLLSKLLAVYHSDISLFQFSSYVESLKC